MKLLIGEIVNDAARAAPCTTAATLGAQTLTFRALDAQANKMAHALQATGIQHGDVVAWWTDTTLHSLTGMLACARLGALFAPLSPKSGLEETRSALQYIAPRLLVCDAERLDAAHATTTPLATVGPLAGTGSSGAHDLGALATTASSTPPVTPELDDEDPHILYLTSGSTGSPKGVLVSHRASWLRSSPGGGTFATGLRGTGGVLSSFPLYHYGGWHYVIEAWLNRTPIHLVPKADAHHLLDAAANRRPTAMYCIPAVWERVLAEPGDLSSVRHADTGTSAVSGDLQESLHRRIPRATTSILYGATEAGRMTVLCDWERDRRPGSVGRATAPGLVDIAEDGEVLFRGPTLMSGYFQLQDATRESVQDGWYHTGDLGHRDDDGYLYLTGRKREVIRSAGETISPVEVEAALRDLPGIHDLAILGLPDQTWGELVCAAVVPAPGAPLPTPAELRTHLRHLASHKHPRTVAAVSHIPRTAATGQVMRARLRETLRGNSRKSTSA